MKRNRTTILIVVSMLLLFAILFIIQIQVFHRASESAFLTVQELSFLPLQVLLVTFLLERILTSREKRERLDKTYIIISAFFSEIGTDALVKLNACTVNFDELRPHLAVDAAWTDKDFKAAAERVGKVVVKMDLRENYAGLFQSLSAKKANLVDMFSNPNLLEHDQFTRMLWAVYHLVDELGCRQGEERLPEKDLAHLALDAERAYALLLVEWIYYMRHLKNAFPYLFSLAMRKNPFNERARVVIS